jgi:PAS domain S-box-containing protein
MRLHLLPSTRPYGVAVGLVASATLLSLGLGSAWHEDLPSLLLYPAVVLSAWYGGLGPGLLATTLSGLVISYYWLPPRYSFVVNNLNDLVGLIEFLALGLLITILTDRRLRHATAVVATLRKSEQRYRYLFQLNPAGMFQCHRDGRLLDCNDAFIRLLDYPSREGALAHNARGLFTHPEDHTALVARLRPGRVITNEEVQWRRRDGTSFAVLLSVREDEDGLLEAIVMDVPARRR